MKKKDFITISSIIFLIIVFVVFDIIVFLAFKGVIFKKKDNDFIYNDNIFVLKGVGTSIGDLISIGDEKFYVIGSNEKKIILLAKYNLDVSGVVKGDEFIISSNSTYLQSKEAIGGHDYTYTNINTVPYSLKGSSYDDSIVKKIVDVYSNYIYNEYNVINKARLITKNELDSLELNEYVFNINAKYPWLTTSSYWSESSVGSGRIWNVYKDYGILFFDNYFVSDLYGVRPVLEIDINYII